MTAAKAAAEESLKVQKFTLVFMLDYNLKTVARQHCLKAFKPLPVSSTLPVAFGQGECNKIKTHWICTKGHSCKLLTITTVITQEALQWRPSVNVLLPSHERPRITCQNTANGCRHGLFHSKI